MGKPDKTDLAITKVLLSMQKINRNYILLTDENFPYTELEVTLKLLYCHIKVSALVFLHSNEPIHLQFSHSGLCDVIGCYCSQCHS